MFGVQGFGFKVSGWNGYWLLASSCWLQATSGVSLALSTAYRRRQTAYRFQGFGFKVSGWNGCRLLAASCKP